MAILARSSFHAVAPLRHYGIPSHGVHEGGLRASRRRCFPSRAMLLSSLLVVMLAGGLVLGLILIRRRRSRAAHRHASAGTGRARSAALAASIHKADALRRQGRIAGARDLLVSAAETHPRVASLQYRLACLHALLGETRAAREALHRACALDRNWLAPARHDPDLRSLWAAATPREFLPPPRSEPGFVTQSAA